MLGIDKSSFRMPILKSNIIHTFVSIVSFKKKFHSLLYFPKNSIRIIAFASLLEIGPLFVIESLKILKAREYSIT